jgi:hypothetical protein
MEGERIEEQDQRPIQPRPLPSLTASAELREALVEEEAWKARLLSDDVEPDELRAAAKGVVAAHYRVKAARALVAGESGALELRTRDDDRPRFIGDS